MDCKRAGPSHKRCRSISQHPENRYPLDVRNPFYERKYVNIPAYITYTTNHPDGTARAVSAIIIRKNIRYHELAK
jgi:hypothetical protein